MITAGQHDYHYVVIIAQTYRYMSCETLVLFFKLHGYQIYMIILLYVYQMVNCDFVKKI